MTTFPRALIEVTIAAPADEVWKTILDIQRVAQAVPGAKVVEQTADGSYKVEIKVKLGPVQMTYKGDVEIVEADEARHRAVMRINAREARGQGTAKATTEMQLAEEGGETKGTIHTDVSLSGRAASMGRGIIGDVSARMIDTFSENLAQMLAPQVQSGNGSGPPDPAPEPEAGAAPTTPPAEAAPPPAGGPPPPDDVFDAGALGGAVLAQRLRDPRVLAALAVLVLAVLVSRRRR